MCFKTAGLPKGSEKTATVTFTADGGAQVNVQAYEHDNKSVHVAFGNTEDGSDDISEFSGAQVFSASDLREVAAQFTKLAAALEA